MSVLIKDMEKPKSCYAVIDGESEYCPFVNTDDDCVLLLKRSTCEGTWEEQYSKCPLVETPEPCEDAVSRADVEIEIANILRRVFVEYQDIAKKTAAKLPSVTPKLPECEDAVSRTDVIDLYKRGAERIAKAKGISVEDLPHNGLDVLMNLPSVMLKPDHIGDDTEMVEYDDCVSRQAVVDVAYEVGNLFDGEDDTRTPYGVAFDIQDAVSKLPSVTPKPEPCEDAVSRKDAIIQLSHNKNGDPDCDVIIQHDIETLKQLPSVTPKRNTGKWIPVGEKCREYIGTVLVNVEYDYWSCDTCGYRVEKGQPMYNFCPNCGAKMNSLPEPYQPKENKS